jgi:hypothetical protein
MTGSAYQAQLVAQLRAAEDELARRRRAAEQVRALHYPEGSMWGGLQCYECQHEYPCPTVTALGGEPAATSVMEAQRYRLAWQSARSRALANLAALDATLDTSALSYALVDAHAELRATEEARDGAYRERAHLTAWLATLHPAVIAPAPDVDEPGWQILYLTAGGRQMSWHIHPRDADLYAHVERVPADDPRAQWDGHTTEAKYQAIQGLAAATGDHSAATRNVIKPSDHDGGTDNVITLPPQPVRPGSIEAEPVTLTARHLSYPRPACPGCEWAAHPPLTCDEVATWRAQFDNLFAEGLTEIRTDDSNAIGYRGVVNAPLSFETIAALAAKLKQNTVPRRKVHRSAVAPATDLTVITTDPVQEIAAEPVTLDALKRKFFAESASRLGAQVGQIGQFFGFPMIADTELPPGEVHMRPHPQTAKARP